MTPTAPKASGRPRLAWFVSFVFLLLACFALPQQAAAQNSDVTVSIAGPNPVKEDDGPARFTVSLSRTVGSPVVLGLTYAGGTTNPATPTKDLGGRPMMVTIPDNENTTGFAVPIIDDNIVEGNETFTVTLSLPAENPPEHTLFLDASASTATVTITDNDPSSTLSMNPRGVRGGGSATFTVNLTNPLGDDLVVNWKATEILNINNMETIEDELFSGTVTISNGEMSATFTTDTTEITPGRTLRVTLSPDGLPDEVSLRDEEKMAEVPIPPAEVTATVNIDDESVVENVSGGTVTFTAALTTAVNSPVVLDVAVTADTATLGVDLGTELPTEVTIDQGQTSATFTVPIENDEIVEGDETFTVTLRAKDGTTLPAGVTIPDGTATGTIKDDDRGLVTLSPKTLTAAEDGTFTYTVSLTAPADVTVHWTATALPFNTATLDGTASDPSDLGTGQDTKGEVTFDANTEILEKTFTIRLNNDDLDENDETFTVILVNAVDRQGAAVPGVRIPVAASSSAATIIDNDGASAVNATVSIADADPVKEDAGPARFTVSLSRTVPSDVVLDITYAADTAGLEDLGRSRPGTVTIPANATTAILAVPITDDTAIEEAETFTVRLSADPNTLPDGVTFSDDTAIGTIAFTPEPSILIEPRRTGAGTALRRHVGRFDRMTSTVVRNRLDDRQTRHLSGSQDLGNGALAMGGGLGDTNWGVWLDGAWAGLGGRSSGRQADIYGGVDYRGVGGDWLLGALIGHELADLDIGSATYEAGYTHFGLYGGARLSARLLVDGALTYGLATPEVAQGSVSASYDAHRLTARGALTGDFGLDYGLEDGVVKLQPQLGLLYAREQLGAFTDSVGGVADREHLELGRVSAGPRVTWAFDGGQLVDGGQLAGGARGQWDFHRLGDGIDERVSGAVDIGLTLDLTPDVSLGLQGDVDGLGITDEFRSFGGKINLGIRF